MIGSLSAALTWPSPALPAREGVRRFDLIRLMLREKAMCADTQKLLAPLALIGSQKGQKAQKIIADGWVMSAGGAHGELKTRPQNHNAPCDIAHRASGI